MKIIRLVALLLIFASACSPSITIATTQPVITPTNPVPSTPPVVLSPSAVGQGPVSTASPVPSELATQPGVNAGTTPNRIPSTGAELSFPIRAAFYYPWFPQAWKQSGLDPFTHFHPSLGFYSEDDPAVIQKQVEAMQYGKIQLGIASWWGQGHHTDKRIPSLLKAGEADGFFWALYIESEGQGDPTSDAIRADLTYIRDHYASSPAYLKIDGRFVVFAYADDKDRCGMPERWKEANTVGAYVVLKVFQGFRDCPAQPDSWHQYAPANSDESMGQNSYTISPGFWKATEEKPRLERDLARWSKSIKAMIASKADFQLITTFNEWGEGTGVEDTTEWQSPSGYGYYLDDLHYDGNLPASLLPEKGSLPFIQNQPTAHP